MIPQTQTTKSIILFNGPPGSGKDTIANRSKYHFGGIVEKFAGPIKQIVPHFYGITKDEFDFMDSNTEEKKKPRDCFYGLSCREVQIAISETYAKPTHDKSIFGKLLISRLEQHTQNNCFYISDSGFKEEAHQLVDKYGADAVTLVRIHRDGATFKGDSRGYIYLDDIHSLDLDNNGDLDVAVQDVRAFVNSRVLVQ